MRSDLIGHKLLANERFHVSCNYHCALQTNDADGVIGGAGNAEMQILSQDVNSLDETNLSLKAGFSPRVAIN